jgi:hypothetical protein
MRQLVGRLWSFGVWSLVPLSAGTKVSKANIASISFSKNLLSCRRRRRRFSSKCWYLCTRLSHLMQEDLNFNPAVTTFVTGKPSIHRKEKSKRTKSYTIGLCNKTKAFFVTTLGCSLGYKVESILSYLRGTESYLTSWNSLSWLRISPSFV